MGTWHVHVNQTNKNPTGGPDAYLQIECAMEDLCWTQLKLLWLQCKQADFIMARTNLKSCLFTQT